MINGNCFGNMFYPRYVSPIELFDSSVLMFSALFLVYVYFRVRSQRKKNIEIVTSIDAKRVDILMQPQNNELRNYNSDKLPFTDQNFTFLKLFLWLLSLLVIVSLLITLFHNIF